ncbi:hypothetical protein DIPPA_09887 [Diplonema papillatum]|nr:hypothetical protein DIPPA_09887 [Diplonema papillatum]
MPYSSGKADPGQTEGDVEIEPSEDGASDDDMPSGLEPRLAEGAAWSTLKGGANKGSSDVCRIVVEPAPGKRSDESVTASPPTDASISPTLPKKVHFDMNVIEKASLSPSMTDDESEPTFTPPILSIEGPDDDDEEDATLSGSFSKLGSKQQRSHQQDESGSVTNAQPPLSTRGVMGPRNGATTTPAAEAPVQEYRPPEGQWDRLVEAIDDEIHAPPSSGNDDANDNTDNNRTLPVSASTGIPQGDNAFEADSFSHGPSNYYDAGGILDELSPPLQYQQHAPGHQSPRQDAAFQPSGRRSSFGTGSVDSHRALPPMHDAQKLPPEFRRDSLGALTADSGSFRLTPPVVPRNDKTGAAGPRRDSAGRQLPAHPAPLHPTSSGDGSPQYKPCHAQAQSDSSPNFPISAASAAQIRVRAASMEQIALPAASHSQHTQRSDGSRSSDLPSLPPETQKIAKPHNVHAFLPAPLPQSRSHSVSSQPSSTATGVGTCSI